VLQYLGKGGTAKVKLGLNTLNNELVALKIFRPADESSMKIKVKPERITAEFKLIEHLHHPNMVNVIEILENCKYEKKNGSGYHTTTIVLEFCAGGETFDYISNFSNFTEEVARTYF